MLRHIRLKSSASAAIKLASHNSVRPIATTSNHSSIKVNHFDNQSISLTIDEHTQLNYNNVFLRDACSSRDSIDPSSSQKKFTTGSIDYKNLQPAAEPKVEQDSQKNDFVSISWNDGQTSQYSKKFLLKYSDVYNRRKGKFFDEKVVLWDSNRIHQNLKSLENISYRDYLNTKDDSKLYQTLKNLNEYGISFVKGIPDVERSQDEPNNDLPLSKIATRIGYIKETFYGKIFDVKSKPNAENIAYTNDFLPLHMDLLYYESPPGIQILHAIKNNCEGGENNFVDSFLVARKLQETDPSAYLALKTIPINFHYKNNDQYYFYSRPLIVEDASFIDPRTNLHVIKEVNYSPPFQAPFENGINKGGLASEIGDSYHFKDFLRGFSKFEKLIESPEYHLTLKLAENSAVIFDNRRILHSRNKFEVGENERWLMGCYLDRDTYQSKSRLIFNKFEPLT